MKINSTFFKYSVISLFFFSIFTLENFAQNDNVGIGTNSPDASSILELESTDKGFLVPRMTTAQRNGIGSPADGLMIFNTDNDRFEYYDALQSDWFGLIATSGVSFDLITSGTNTNQTLTIGNNSELIPSGNGRIVSTEFANAASTSANVDLATSEVNGILPIANGGTNAGSFTSNEFLLYDGNAIIASGFDSGDFLGQTLNNNFIFVGNAANTAVGVNMSGDVDIDNTGQTTIQPLAVETGMIDNNAVDGTKIFLSSNANGDLMYYNGTDYIRLAIGSPDQILTVNGGIPSWEDNNALSDALNSANIFVGNAANTAVGVAMTGDISIDNTGQTTIQDNSVDGTDINILGNGSGDLMYYDGTDWTTLGAGSNGQYLQLNAGLPSWQTSNFLTATLSNGQIFVGDAGNTAVGRTPGGDVSMNNLGVYSVNSVQAGAIITASIQDNAVDGAKINISGNANGDLMYYNGTDWVRLTPGTSGQFLQTNGAALAPSWEDVPAVPTGSTLNASLRWNGTDWVENLNLLSDGSGSTTIGSNGTPGSMVIYDINGNNTAIIQLEDITTNRNYNIPATLLDADFVITESDQTINGEKTFSELLTVGSGIDIDPNKSTAQELKFYDGGGTNYIGFRAPNSITFTADYILPTAEGSDGEVLTLQNAFTGQLEWTAAGSGNTLDEAYDQGGGGAGRTITADNGAVEITNNAANNVPLLINNQSATANSLTVQTNNEDITIDANGNVGIGETSVSGQLQVASDYVHIGSNAGAAGLADSEGDLFVENDLEVDGTFRLGEDGSDLTDIIKATATIDVGNINTYDFVDVTTTVTGAQPGASVIVSPSTDLEDDVIIGYAFVSAANTVTIRFINNDDSSSRDPASQNYHITVIQ